MLSGTMKLENGFTSKTSNIQPTKLLKLRSEQYQKAKEKGHDDLTTLTEASSMVSSIHKDTLTTQSI